MHFSSTSKQLCTAEDTSVMRITSRKAVPRPRKYCKARYIFMHPSWIVGKVILLVNIFESKRVTTYNSTISHLHGKPWTWRPESWCGIDAWVPQDIYCEIAAVRKRKWSRNCGGWKLSQIRQMKVKANLNITSPNSLPPPTRTPVCLLVKCICVSLFNFLPTYYLGSNPKSVDWFSEMLNTEMLSANFKEAIQFLALLKTMPSKLYLY